MTDLIARLEGLSAKATKGPWQVEGCRHKGCELGPDTRFHAIGPDGDKVAMVFFDMKTGLGLLDAKLIVELVNNLPEILNALRARTGQIEAQGGSDA